ncbi:MAG: glycosyltransferase [Myxococcota bacterium]|nr:glycosyltransferase [Myxococcota bacterium]
MTSTNAEPTSNDRPLPHVTIVIPVYNEEGLLETAVVSLREALRERFGWPYELILAENGSLDATLPIARRLSEKYPEVRYIALGEPNYGKALKRGILESRGHYVICDEIDLCDVDFYHRALEKLDLGYELVVGSKLAPGAEDKRPVFRHVATRVINGLLHLTTGFKGTDTHGLKAFVRDRLLETVADCLVERDLFASELVIRAERRNIRICEIPIRVVEKRAPSINLVRRVPGVLKGLVKLAVAVRIRS